MSEREIPPPSGAWSRIEESLLAGAKARRVIMWRRLTGVAAVIAALIIGYLAQTDWLMLQQEGKPSIAEVKSGESQTIENTVPLSRDSAEPKKDWQQTVGKINAVSPRPLATGMEKPNPKPHPASHLATTHPSGELPLTILNLSYAEEPIDDLVLDPVKLAFIPVRFSTLNAPIQVLNLPDRNLHAQNRWQLTGYAGRTFASYFTANATGTGNAAYQNDMVQITQEQIIRPLASFGMGIGIQVADRFSLHTGTMLNQFSTTLSSGEQEMTILSNRQTVTNIFGELTYNSSVQNNLDNMAMLEVPSSELIQRFSWIEIPLTGSYVLLQGPIDIAIKAGFGGNILAGNSVTRKDGDNLQEIGTTSGLQKFYLSGMAGLDLSYKAGNSWVISFNPVYRQSLQPVTQGAEVRPYLMNLGIYSGISFRF